MAKRKNKKKKGTVCRRPYWSRQTGAIERAEHKRYRKGVSANAHYKAAKAKAKKIKSEAIKLERKVGKAKTPEARAKLEARVAKKRGQLAKASQKVAKWSQKAEQAGFKRSTYKSKSGGRRTSGFKPKGFGAVRCKRKNNWVNMFSTFKEAATYTPGIGAGMGSGYMLPGLAGLDGGKAALASLGIAVIGGLAAWRFLSFKQGVGFAIGGGVAAAVRGVAALTAPGSPVRKAVGIGLADLGAYAGLGDCGDEQLIDGGDDVPALDFDDEGNVEHDFGVPAGASIDEDLVGEMS